MPIHATAIVDTTAVIDPTADIGAYAVIEGHTTIGPQARVWAHGFIGWGTSLGARVQVHPFAVVGHLPQDVAFDGSPSYTHIGDDTIVREHASIHRGTTPESTTLVGSGCMIMSTGHIAHNCVVGDSVVIVNAGLLAGHVHVGDRAFVGGGAGVHQFTRVGEMVMLRGNCPCAKDVPPFMLVGPRGVTGVNTVGLRRGGLSAAERLEIRRCYHILYRGGMHFPKAVEEVSQLVTTGPGRRLVEFLRSDSRRGYLRYQGPRRGATDSDRAE